MAAAAPSPLASSVEKTNGAKLSRLLIDGGTTVLRMIFDRYHPPANLLADLNANFLALDNLLRKRVLHRPQWDLLFPPGGATPDSNTFDITLLFLLLTNICGLFPPPSGWHTKPPPGDTSLEANLARIKFFRNGLYGHVTTTGVDTPTFSALWLEISAVLVALGLHQAEIDRLKAERCGEEDYIDVLLEWADSEKDIKSQLKDISKSQTKVQHTVYEVRQTQLEGREILQYSKGKLDEVHQLQTITQETIDEVRQTQLKDREIIQDSNVKLQEVYQIDRKTHQVVTNIRQTQTDDSRTFRQMCHNTEQGVARLHERQHEVHKTLQDTKSKVEEISQSHEELKQTVEDLGGQREKHRQHEILKKLAKIDTLNDMKHHAERYVEGTRLSIFGKVESWLNDISSPNRVMVISAVAGMGKSVISAVVCQKMLEAGRLAGSHFCQHDRARHRNPKVMLQSLASHLAESLPDYKKALVEKLSRNLGVEINDMEVKDLFELLFEEPLTSLNGPGLTYLMVIDGLDESEYQGRNELLDLIANYFRKLPLWMRFFMTTRPEINIADKLKCLHPLQLEPNNEENLKDIRLCFKEQLHHVLQSEYEGNIFQALVEKSEGVMLYAHYLVDFINKNVPLLTPELLDSTLPSGIASVYESYFKRLESDLCKEVKVTDDQFMNFLSAIAAAREPLPLGFVCKLLLSGKSPSAVQRKVNVAIACVSALLPVQDGRIHFFHKSVKDWLIDSSYYGQHHFSVDEKQGHHVLSKLCIDELDDVKRKGVDGPHFIDTTKYALQHGVQHMLQLEEDARVCSLEDVAKKYCLDLELVYGKLCVGHVTASEDILCVQKQEGAKALFEEWQRALGALLYLLRKHLSTLTELPHAIFQILLNEGGPELSSEALTLLETRYSEIPYMEFLHKNDQEVLVQTKFQCSDEVVCFDVSPQLDYMVCECKHATIQLWSLHTGKQLWKRHVKVLKKYNFLSFLDYVPYRVHPSSACGSFYRSVVFHPTERLVLPGILSHAYTIDGDLKLLFLSSKCRFSVCSISGDKTKMLTDCPDDAKSIVMWSLTDGSEITRFACIVDILSFAWSRDERLLAISGSFGNIWLVDVLNGFKTLAQTTTSGECGLIKFSPDCRFLFCLHSGMSRYNSCELFRLNVNTENDCNFSLDVLPNVVYYYPWKFESCSETGFLLGDPFCFFLKRDTFEQRPELAFVLNKQSVLRVSSSSSVIEMLNPDELTKGRNGFLRTAAREVIFSLNGDTLYVVTGNVLTQKTLGAWDISSERFKAEKRVDLSSLIFRNSFVVAVRAGVIFLKRTDTLELWNSELSQCIRRWTVIGEIHRVHAISEERLACEFRHSNTSEVVILDTTSGDVVSTVTIHGEFVACNSKCQVITRTHKMELQMQCGEVVLWKISQSFDVRPSSLCNTFSPTEQFCVVGGKPESDDVLTVALYVLDAVSGRTLHMLCTLLISNPLCKFVSDEECVISIKDVSKGNHLVLFNVKSGDLLSKITMESAVYSLAACPRRRLVAIGVEDSKYGFKVLQVKLPRDKDSRKNKRSVLIKKQSENIMHQVKKYLRTNQY